MRTTPKKASSTLLKLLAVTTSIALVGTYVGYRVLRADARPPAVEFAPSPAPAATVEDPLVRPALADPDDLVHFAGSKSMIGVVEPRDVEPKVIVPPRAPAPAPGAPRK